MPWAFTDGREEKLWGARRSDKDIRDRKNAEGCRRMNREKFMVKLWRASRIWNMKAFG